MAGVFRTRECRCGQSYFAGTTLRFALVSQLQGLRSDGFVAVLLRTDLSVAHVPRNEASDGDCQAGRAGSLVWRRLTSNHRFGGTIARITAENSWLPVADRLTG